MSEAQWVLRPQRQRAWQRRPSGRRCQAFLLSKAVSAEFIPLPLMLDERMFTSTLRSCPFVDEAVIFEHEQLVHLDEGTYHWVSLKQFRIDPTQTDSDLLRALISHWAYHDDYAGRDAIDQDHHSFHGPYRLECIAADTFRPARAAIAESLLQAWAEEASDRSISPQVQHTLDRAVYPLLSDDSLYQLPDLRPDAEHDWGWVVGREGFHEYIAIDRQRELLTLIVAADD